MSEQRSESRRFQSLLDNSTMRILCRADLPVSFNISILTCKQKIVPPERVFGEMHRTRADLSGRCVAVLCVREFLAGLTL